MFILISFIFFNTSDQFHQSSPGDTHRIQGHTGRQQASCVRNIFFLFSFPSIFLFYLILMNKNSDPGLLIVIHRKRTHKMNRGRERWGGRERDCKALAHEIMRGGRASMISLQDCGTGKPVAYFDISTAKETAVHIPVHVWRPEKQARHSQENSIAAQPSGGWRQRLTSLSRQSHRCEKHSSTDEGQLALHPLRVTHSSHSFQ